MPKFSESSLKILGECDIELQMLFYAVIKNFNCKVICGHRNEFDQNEAFKNKKSKKKYPDSKHNEIPSLAVDVAPYPVDFNDKERFYYFGGFVRKTAEILGINVRWGGDWDNDTETADQKFNDLLHFELI